MWPAVSHNPHHCTVTVSPVGAEKKDDSELSDGSLWPNNSKTCLHKFVIYADDTEPEVAGVCKSIGCDLWFTARRVQCHQYRGLRPRRHRNILHVCPPLHWQWYTALHVQLSKYYFSCLLLLILSFLCASSRLFCPHASAQPLSRMSLGGNNCSGSTLGMSTFGAPLSVRAERTRAGNNSPAVQLWAITGRAPVVPIIF